MNLQENHKNPERVEYCRTDPFSPWAAGWQQVPRSKARQKRAERGVLRTAGTNADVLSNARSPRFFVLKSLFPKPPRQPHF